jgi:hypothetical protein
MNLMSSTNPERDLGTFLNSYFQDLVNRGEDPGVVQDRYYTPDIEYVNDGVSLDRERLIEHSKAVRENVLESYTEIHEALLSADRIAARQSIHAKMRNGTTMLMQAYMFARLAPDGRFQRIEQITRTLPMNKPGSS